jgi:hypothetical protein
MLATPLTSHPDKSAVKVRAVEQTPDPLPAKSSCMLPTALVSHAAMSPYQVLA